MIGNRRGEGPMGGEDGVEGKMLRAQCQDVRVSSFGSSACLIVSES